MQSIMNDTKARFIVRTAQPNDAPAVGDLLAISYCKLDFGHSGGITERVGDAFAQRRTEFCRVGWTP